jgi:hypothetical protein
VAAEAFRLHAQLLQRASEILGGSEQLESFLDVSEARLRRWSRGITPLPDDVFLKLVDLVSENQRSHPAVAKKNAVAASSDREN